MTTPQPVAPRYSSLQLAWLQELGIEKPWLPGDMPAPQKQTAAPAASPTPAAVAPRAVKSQQPPRAAAPAAVESAPHVQVDTHALARVAADLPSLAATIKGCQACGLCSERQQAVTGDGVMQPAIMVIGEAPGNLEDREGKPFVGRPGLMLDNMLSAIQCGRAQNVYVSNIVKCRPPGNRNPKPAELAACKPFLMRQIALVRPFSILAVGRAAQSLLETDAPLDTLRQVTHSLMVGDEKIPLIATIHPTRLLNHPNEKAAAWQDLQLVRTVAGL